MFLFSLKIIEKNIYNNSNKEYFLKKIPSMLRKQQNKTTLPHFIVQPNNKFSFTLKRDFYLNYSGSIKIKVWLFYQTVQYVIQ